MNVWKWLLGTAFSISLSSGLCSQPAEPVNPDANLLVSGKLVRVDEPRSYEGKVVFAEGAHVIVRLAYISGVNGMTGGVSTPPPDILSVTQRIENVKGFPIRYRLEGDPEEVFRFPAHSYGSGGFYTISAAVHMGASDELYIGDYLSEYLEVVYGPTSERDIKVLGQEDCDSPNAGGSCLSNKRP